MAAQPLHFEETWPRAAREASSQREDHIKNAVDTLIEKRKHQTATASQDTTKNGKKKK